MNSGVYQVIMPNTLDEILNVAEEYNVTYHLPHPANDLDCMPFYRGQGNSQWMIQPSICRANDVSDEKEAYDRLKGQLNDKKSLFDKVSYIQHYMTGTRFIDFTLNYDIALFFACNEKACVNRDGAVYLWSYSPHISNWIDTIIMMEIIDMDRRGYVTVKELCEMLMDRHREELMDYNHRVSELEKIVMGYLDYGYMVLPDDYRDNERMRRQYGAFFICGVEFTKTIVGRDRYETKAGNNIFISHSVSVPEDLRTGNRLVKCIIKNDLKSDVMKYLYDKGITEEYIMPK